MMVYASVPPSGGKYRRRSEAEAGVGGRSMTRDNEPLPILSPDLHYLRMERQQKTPHAQSQARRLRKDMTPSEVALWKHLRGSKLGHRFRRQEPIGPYIVDFVCFDRRLVVEADGDHHEKSRHDARRDAYLRREGFRVLRFWNDDIALQMEWVLREIKVGLRTDTPLPPS